MCYSFGIVDVEHVAIRINTLFSLDSCIVGYEFIRIQSDVQLKALRSEVSV
jgi:hypothetical protein